MPVTGPGWTLAEHGVDDPDTWWRTVEFPRLATAMLARDPLISQISVMARNVERFGVPLVGRTRAVFRPSDGYVIKVAHTEEGLEANALEATVSQAPNPAVPVTPTELLDDGSARAQEVQVLVVTDYRTVPSWVGSVDCAQVGYLADGRLVAYDL
ncbi:hypothetical protein ACWIGI_37530 [Nocardia sp. NPDC055321]